MEKEELEEMAKLCLKYDVIIISDEIHADLVFPNQMHIPIASLSQEVADHTITCMAPSKTFNLAGLDASYVITSNEENRKKLDASFNKQGFHNQLNTMGNTAMEAAYTLGEPWLEELNRLIENHTNYVTQMFDQHIPELKVVKTEGTYLLWINCSALNMDSKSLNKFMIEKAKVGLNSGASYGKEGEHYMRMNIACPRATLEEGVKRIIDAVQSLNK